MGLQAAICGRALLWFGSDALLSDLFCHLVLVCQYFPFSVFHFACPEVPAITCLGHFSEPPCDYFCQSSNLAPFLALPSDQVHPPHSLGWVIQNSTCQCMLSLSVVDRQKVDVIFPLRAIQKRPFLQDVKKMLIWAQHSCWSVSEAGEALLM